MADETTFKSGDVVQLNSGGPLVTVHSVGNGGYFTYYYIDKDGLINLRKESALMVAFKKVGTSTDESQSPNPEAGGAI